MVPTKDSPVVTINNIVLNQRIRLRAPSIACLVLFMKEVFILVMTPNSLFKREHVNLLVCIPNINEEEETKSAHFRGEFSSRLFPFLLHVYPLISFHLVFTSYAQII